MNINKTYVVNLNDRIDRWKLFENLNSNITRFSAIDTRVNPFVFLDYNLTLNPVNKNNEHYFSQSKGAIGCYLSHYCIWKNIIENEYESVLILEDDSNPSDVKNFLENIEKDFLNNYDIVQLAKRNQHDNDLVNYFCGTSSYYCNKKAAQVLINATHDFSEMDNYELPTLPWRIQKRKLENCDLIHQHYNTFILKNSIRVPVDTFIGLNSCDKICSENQLKIKHEPLISLNDDFESSDILAKNTKHYFEMSCDELNEFELSKNYKWWENNPNDLGECLNLTRNLRYGN